MMIETTECKTCPFLGDEYEQKVCNLLHWMIHTPGDIKRATWIDDRGFNEMYEDEELPKSCPLRDEQVVVKLKQ